MVSIPAKMLAADQNDLKPIMGLTTRLIARWSCSMMLFRYLIRRTLMSTSESARTLSIAAVLAPLLSMVIFSGTPFKSMARSRNRRAAATSRLAVSRKSTVSPARSTVRYKYFQCAYAGETPRRAPARS